MLQARLTLGISYLTLMGLVDAGEIGIRRIPGGRPRVSKVDVDRVLTRSTTPATAAHES